MATTDLRIGGLALAAALLALPAAAQQPPSEQQLIERLRQIQAEAKGGGPPAPPQADGPAAPDAALLPPEQIAADLGERLGVEVLGVEQVEAEEGPRYAVKVMNPPGDYNAAFQVSTLLVDAASGEVLGEAGTEGAERPQAASDLDSGLEARRRTWR